MGILILPVHEGYLPVYFKEYCYLPPPPPPSKQASTIHGYFVSATPHTDIRLLWRWLLYLVVLPLYKLWSVALSNFTVGWSASQDCGIS